MANQEFKKSSLERITSNTDNFKQTITIKTERKTGETIIRKTEKPKI